MTNEQDVIKNIESYNKKGANFDKYIKKLRNINKLDVLINFAKINLPTGIVRETNEKYTLLMYFVMSNDLTNVKKLLEGSNPANPCVVNSAGESALYLAILYATSIDTYNLSIIDELLKYEPKKQVELQRNEGKTALFLAVQNENLNIIKKLTAINNNNQFLLTALITKVNPLCFAVEKQLSIEVIDELLKYYPDEQVLSQNAQGMIPLHLALYNGNVEIAKRLLTYKSVEQLNSRDNKNNSSFDFALNSKNYDLIEWLVKNYPYCIDQISSNDITPLYRGCQIKDLAIIKLILANGGTTQIFTPVQGLIPLSLSCETDTQDIAQELLKYEPKEQIEYIDMLGENILARACYYGSINVLKLLLSKIKDLQIDFYDFLIKKNQEGYTPLHVAVLNPSKKLTYPLAIINELLNIYQNEQLEQKDEDGRTALTIAVEENNYEIAVELVKYMRPEHYLVAKPNGAIALYHAVQESYTEVVKLLLEYGPKEQLEMSVEEFFPVHIAAKQENLQILLRILSKNDAQKYKTTSEKLTPLHMAAYYGNILSLQALLKFKSDRLVREERQCLPFHLACQEGHLEIAKELLKENFKEQLYATNIDDCTALHLAVMAGRSEIVKFLLNICDQSSRYELLNKQDIQGFTPLHFACFFKHQEIADLLINAGSDINKLDFNNTCSLHIISLFGHISIFDLLPKNNMNLKAPNDLGALPIHLACEQGHLLLAQKLYDLAKDTINIKDKLGRTPLFYAVINDHIEVVDYLASQGADINSSIDIDNEIVTTLRIAIEKLNIDMVKKLIKLSADPLIPLNKNNNAPYTIIDLIQDEYPHDEEIQKMLLKIIDSGTKTLPEKPQSDSSTFLPPTERPQKLVTGRSYLKSVGYSEEDIEEFENERKNLQIKMKIEMKKPSFFSKVEQKREELFSWFGNKLASDNSELFSIICPDKQNSFCYLDKESLLSQNCDITYFKDLRLKFSNKSIKKLDKDKAEYYDSVYISGKLTDIKYTHELKINKIDRVLLFKIKSDDNRACLYIGAKYIEAGLHVKAKIRDLRLSLKKGTLLQINLPFAENRYDLKK